MQDTVNTFMHEIVSDELSEVLMQTGLKIDKGDTTGTKFVTTGLHQVLVPAAMSKVQGAHNLLKQFKEEETTRVYNREYKNIFVNDFIVVMNQVITKYFGLIHVSRVDTTLRPAGNDYIQIPTGYDNNGNLEHAKGYVGSVLAPVWEDAIIDIRASGSIAVLAKLKYEGQVNDFLADIEKLCKSTSVVKGQSVTVQSVYGGMLATPISPKENKKIILSDQNERIIGNLIIPSLADQSKTSLLFTGDFGTGKTETAIRVGIAGQKKYKRTFFYLHNAELFAQLIPYLKNYQGSIVFVEDVDQLTAGDRDTNMNNLLNQLDGNELKNVNCTFIFTTNNHEKIHPAMRRPGRIDQVVHFDYCDVPTIAKIFELYAEGFKGAETVDFMAAAEKVPEKLQGAVVAEIARRAQKYATKLHDGVISTDVFMDAVASMDSHIKFMRADQKKDLTAEALLAQVATIVDKRAYPGNFANPEVPKSEGTYAALI